MGQLDTDIAAKNFSVSFTRGLLSSIMYFHWENIRSNLLRYFQLRLVSKIRGSGEALLLGMLFILTGLGPEWYRKELDSNLRLGHTLSLLQLFKVSENERLSRRRKRINFVYSEKCYSVGNAIILYRIHSDLLNRWTYKSRDTHLHACLWSKVFGRNN